MGSDSVSKEKANGDKKAAPTASKDQVVAYLERHPDFLVENPELVKSLKAPKSDLGDGVVDLQHFMVGGLQKELTDLRGKYDEIVEYCRENMSTQAQVHGAISRMIKARDLEQLLQVITIDLASLFDVDVVRLAMETVGADMYETSYPEAHYSGISFIETGMVDDVMGVNGAILLCEDVDRVNIHGLDAIFADCVNLVKSCALLRLSLEHVQKDVILGFGVRHPGRFNTQQGVELLAFLAHIVELRLDSCLSEIDPEELV